MGVKLHPHAQARLIERGATKAEVIATVEERGGGVALLPAMRVVAVPPFLLSLAARDSDVTLLSMLSGEEGWMPRSGWRRSL
jgi:hypothetical protein